MSDVILITGAGSGLGEGAALGLARQGRAVIAAAQSWPQVTALRLKVQSEKLNSLRVEKLDLLDAFDVTRTPMVVKSTTVEDMVWSFPGVSAISGEAHGLEGGDGARKDHRQLRCSGGSPSPSVRLQWRRHAAAQYWQQAWPRPRRISGRRLCLPWR